MQQATLIENSDKLKEMQDSMCQINCSTDEKLVATSVIHLFIARMLNAKRQTKVESRRPTLEQPFIFFRLFLFNFRSFSVKWVQKLGFASVRKVSRASLHLSGIKLLSANLFCEQSTRKKTSVGKMLSNRTTLRHWNRPVPVAIVFHHCEKRTKICAEHYQRTTRRRTVIWTLFHRKISMLRVRYDAILSRRKQLM